MEYTLKPCPKCGFPMPGLRTANYNYQVECINCGLHTKLYWRDKDKAIEEWNTMGSEE